MTEKSELTSKVRARILIKAAMEALNETGGSLPLKDVKKAMVQKVVLDEQAVSRVVV